MLAACTDFVLPRSNWEVDCSSRAVHPGVLIHQIDDAPRPNTRGSKSAGIGQRLRAVALRRFGNGAKRARHPFLCRTIKPRQVGFGAAGRSAASRAASSSARRTERWYSGARGASGEPLRRPLSGANS